MRFSEYLQLCEQAKPPVHIMLEDGFYLQEYMSSPSWRAITYHIMVLMHKEEIGTVEVRKTGEDGTGMWIYSMSDNSMSGTIGVPNKDIFNWHELGEWVMQNLRDDGVVEKYT